MALRLTFQLRYCKNDSGTVQLITVHALCKTPRSTLSTRHHEEMEILSRWPQERVQQRMSERHLETEKRAGGIRLCGSRCYDAAPV